MRSLTALVCSSALLLSSLAGCGSEASSDSGEATPSSGGTSASAGTGTGGSVAGHAGGAGIAGHGTAGNATAAGGASTGGAGVGGASAGGSSAGGTSAGGASAGHAGTSATGGHVTGGSGGVPGGTGGGAGTSGGQPGAGMGGTGGEAGASAGGATGGGAGNGGGTGGASSATCGCHGQPGCAIWENVYITFYGFNDNSCTVESQHNCDDIAFPGLGPKKHAAAQEGTGTYDDPITAAAGDQTAAGSKWETSGGATLSPGTLVYNPEVQKYFIMEDSCLECGDEWACHLSKDDTDDPKPPAGCQPGTNLHIDFWMGPSFQQDATDLNTCEDNSTFGEPYKGTGTVVVNPPPDLPVKPALLYSGTGTGGGCWTKKQIDGDACK